MTKVKKCGIASLIINGILSIGGGLAFLYVREAIKNMD